MIYLYNFVIVSNCYKYAKPYRNGKFSALPIVRLSTLLYYSTTQHSRDRAVRLKDNLMPRHVCM